VKSVRVTRDFAFYDKQIEQFRKITRQIITKDNYTCEDKLTSGTNFRRNTMYTYFQDKR